MIYDIGIIGAGASGLMSASLLTEKYPNKNIIIIDQNKSIGAKIKVSGGAKCNITNKYLSSSKYLGDSSFIDPILDSFTNKDLLNFLAKYNLIPKLKEKIVQGTYFCNSSDEVLNLFKKLTSTVRYSLSTTVQDVDFVDNVFVIDTNHSTIKVKKLIVSSGGLSYPILGSSDIGYKIAQKFGHTINTLNPALVGFTVQKEQFWFKELSGLSLDNVVIKVDDKVCRGGLLFTHKGFSGPVVLTTSLYWKKGKITIDFLPNKDSYLPKRFRQAFLKYHDKKMLRNYTFAPAGNFGYTKAEVTKGGIDTNEIDINTMESKYQKGLYFLGEVLDVTGELGGYNFQWAFSSAKRLSL